MDGARGDKCFHFYRGLTFVSALLCLIEGRRTIERHGGIILEVCSECISVTGEEGWNGSGGYNI